MSDDIRESIRRFDAAVAERDRLRTELHEQDLTLTKVRHRAYQLEVDRDRLQELLAAAKADYDALTAERDRLLNTAADAEEALIAQGGSLHFAEEQLARAETVVTKAATVARLWGEVPYLNRYPESITALNDLAAAVDAYQATPATTEPCEHDWAQDTRGQFTASCLKCGVTS